MILRIGFLFLFAICSPLSAKELDKNNALAAEAYELAISKVHQGRQWIEPGRSISYTETIEEKQGKKQFNTKRIRLDTNGIKIRESIDSENATASLNWDYNVLVDPASFPRHAQLIKESEEHWVFEIPAKVSAGTESSQQEINVSQVNQKIGDALTTELIISKTNPRLLSQKTYARFPFKPQSMVTIDEFNVRIEYTMAWEKGPWIATSISRTLSGTYALFVDIEEFSLVRNEQFKLLNES